MKWLLILLALATAAQADVTHKRKTSSVTFGGAFEATATEYYAADRSATESSTHWTRG
jgi:hypothetical protein